MDNEKIEKILAQVYDMGKTPSSGEPIVRRETINWAKKELCQLFESPQSMGKTASPQS